MDADTNSTIISLATIFPLTFKSPSIEEDVLTTNPLFGEIDAVAEPDAILNASSTNAERGILFNLLPSPWNEPENEPLNSLAVTTLALTALNLDEPVTIK